MELEIIEKLKNCTIDNTKLITYNFTKAKVLKVYDGDTFTIAGFHNGDFCKFSVRLYGVNCEEIKGGTAETKKLAQDAKKFVEDMILDKIVDIDILNNKIIDNKKMTEKYGRLLCNVKIDNNDLAISLLNAGLAKPYFGGHK
jgi:endonuclease YncB( thermonuclease family)